jgi:hypothetical protein
MVAERAAHLTTAVARFRFAPPKFCSISFRKTSGVPQTLFAINLPEEKIMRRGIRIRAREEQDIRKNSC